MLALLTLGTLGAAMPLPSFEEWTLSRGKSYSALELPLRQKIYERNAGVITAHNALNLSWTMGVNAYSDLAPEEFKAAMTGGYMRTAGYAHALRGGVGSVSSGIAPARRSICPGA